MSRDLHDMMGSVMPRTSFAIAVDVGGTTAKVALVGVGGRVHTRLGFSTGRRMPVSAFLRELHPMVRRVTQEARRLGGVPVGMGVGVPGTVDARRGVIRGAVNLPQWQGAPLQQACRRMARLPVLVENDVNAMAWGQYCWGAGRGTRSLVCLTLGTGIGGGMVLEGRLYHGWTMSAGEIGHVPLAWRGPRCPCGGLACLERYAGNRAVLALAGRLLQRHRRGALWGMVAGRAGRVTPPLIDQAARRGDPLARRVWREIGERIGLALTGLVNVINPERIVIGGGLAKAGPWLFPAIRATVRARAMPACRSGRPAPSAVAIVPARWGEDAGLVGAAALILVPEGRRR